MSSDPPLKWWPYAVMAGAAALAALSAYIYFRVQDARVSMGTARAGVACDATIGKSAAADCSAWPPPPPALTSDPWGGSLSCVRLPDGSAEIVSLGSDGKPGGQGTEVDVHCWRSTSHVGPCQCRIGDRKLTRP